MDFSNYKFRCSSLGKLMTKPRSKTEVLSETTKTYLMEIFIEEKYGRKREIVSKYLTKGNHAEEDSLDLVTKLHNKLYIKNKETLEGDLVKGTPDIITTDGIIDIKTCWDIWTFAKADGTNKDYYWQLQGYMMLTGLERATLIYTLVNTPEFLIVSEKNKRQWQDGYADGSQEQAEMEKEVEKNMMFDDIDPKIRMKTFDFDANEWQQLEVKIHEARAYLNSLSL